MGDQLPLPKMAIMLLVFLIIGVVIWQVYAGHTLTEVGGPGGFVFKFSNNTPPVKEISAHENLLASNYHYMYLDEENLFGASIALDDSVKEAINDLPTGNVITDGKITPTYGNKSNVTMVSTNQTMFVGTRVDLNGTKNLEITPATSLTSEAQDIPHDNPGQNFATWKWWVKPGLEGPGTLFITAYTVDDKGHRTPINSTQKEIKVIAISAPTYATPATKEYVEAAKENVTKIVAKENVTKAAEAAPAAAKKQPGFEGVFAIAGLLAVAYLVLSRRE